MADGADQPAGDAWGDDIPPQRQAELEQRLQAWEQEADHGDRKGPFDRIELTGADVFWLASQVLVGESERYEFGIALATLRQTPAKRHQGPDLSALQLQGSRLASAKLQGASLAMAELRDAVLDEADLRAAFLEGVDLAGASLVGANLQNIHLFMADLRGATLKRADLQSADLTMAALQGANLEAAQLQHTTLVGAQLEHASLLEANLQSANLEEAQLQGAVLVGAVLQGANLGGASLQGAYMTGSVLDETTILRGVVLSDAPNRATTALRRILRQYLYGPVSLADVHWNGAQLTVVDWSRLRTLGDERDQPLWDRSRFERGEGWWWHRRYKAERATRANIQLAKQLHDAGLNIDADRFAYRAQVCQRGIHLLRFHVRFWLFSWLLYLLAGYGYRPFRTLFWYLAVIGAFAFAYFQATHGALTFGLPRSQIQPLAWYEALVLSVSSFHGRGFFQPVQSLGDPVAILAAAEAVLGLFIEISFIATFTQRYFGK